MNKKKLIKLIAECANVEYEDNNNLTIADVVYNYYEDAEMFTPEELKLVTNINGYNIQTLNDMLFVRYGYRDLEQMMEGYKMKVITKDGRTKRYNLTLLELYKELSKLKDDVIHSIMFGKDYEHLRIKTLKIEKQIKELENE